VTICTRAFVGLCFQKLPETMSTTERCANNPAKLCVISQTAQLAVVATVYQGAVVYVW